MKQFSEKRRNGGERRMILLRWSALQCHPPHPNPVSSLHAPPLQFYSFHPLNTFYAVFALPLLLRYRYHAHYQRYRYRIRSIEPSSTLDRQEHSCAYNSLHLSSSAIVLQIWFILPSFFFLIAFINQSSPSFSLFICLPLDFF